MVSPQDFLGISQGDAIAVKSALGDDEWILAGQVLSTATDTTEEETPLERLSETNTSTTLLTIDADTWWELSDREFIDRSHVLKDRPQMQEHLAEPPKDAPPCSLTYWSDGRVGLTIPMPVANTSRVRYYTGDDYGTIVALDSGAVVDPNHLLEADDA